MNEDAAPLSEEQARQFIAGIPGHAESHRELIRKTFGVELDFSAESIPKLDEVIKEGWPDGPPVMLEPVVMGFGSYLGETIRRLHAGEWKFSDESGLHLLVEGVKLWPFAKVKKRFLNGEEDSLGFYYSDFRHVLEKEKSTPPPIPSAPHVAAPAAPPPLPATAARKKKRSPILSILLVVGLLVLAFVGFLGYRMVQFVRYARTHPHQVQPGEAEFNVANRQIIGGDAGGAFGNSADAIALATKYSKSMKVLRDSFFTKDKPTTLGSMEGDFVTYCQLNGDSCVFLVHVPELRRFDGDAKKSLADLAWFNAQAVLKVESASRKPPKTVVVGMKGLMFYDAIMIGDYVDVDVDDAKPTADGRVAGIKTRGSGLSDMKLFYPYFAAPASTNAAPAMKSNPAASLLSPGATNVADITIQSAMFGAGKNAADVTERLRALLLAQPDGFIVNPHNLGANPEPNKKKSLTIHYACQGSDFKLTVPAGKQLTRQALLDKAKE